MEVSGDSDLSPFVDAPGRKKVLESSLVLASCHAGIDGLPVVNGGGVTEGPRLRRRVFRDFSSCCNSARL